MNTTIDLAPYINQFLPAVITLLGSILIALLTWLLTIIKQRYNVALSQANQQTLQIALVNAAGKVVMLLAERLKDAKLDVGSPVVKEGVDYVLQSAGEAVKSFDLKPEQIAEKIIAKVGVITAADPSVHPKDVTPPPPDPGKGG